MIDTDTLADLFPLTSHIEDLVGVDVGRDPTGLHAPAAPADVKQGFLLSGRSGQTSTSTQPLLHKPAVQHWTAAAACYTTQGRQHQATIGLFELFISLHSSMTFPTFLLTSQLTALTCQHHILDYIALGWWQSCTSI